MQRHRLGEGLAKGVGISMMVVMLGSQAVRSESLEDEHTGGDAEAAAWMRQHVETQTLTLGQTLQRLVVYQESQQDLLRTILRRLDAPLERGQPLQRMWEHLADQLDAIQRQVGALADRGQ